MSYPMDLDEYDDEMIRREAAKRAELRAQGHCTYCRQHSSAPPCRFPNRHRATVESDPLTVECSYCLAKPGKPCRLSKAGARMVSGHKGDPCDPHLTRIDRARYEHSRTETAGRVSGKESDA